MLAETNSETARFPGQAEVCDQAVPAADTRPRKQAETRKQKSRSPRKSVLLGTNLSSKSCAGGETPD
jgi:hypothetical protein